MNEEIDRRQTHNRMQCLSKLYAVDANWNAIKACNVCNVAELVLWELPFETAEAVVERAQDRAVVQHGGH